MSPFTEIDKQYLLALARSVVAAKLTSGSMVSPPAKLSPAVHETRGCFVTLHKQGVLRGCIGTIEPIQALVDGVTENAINAAFRDPRFPPLEAEELIQVKFEISVLTVPRELAFNDAEDLKQQLKPGIHGVILSREGRRATFLPQVWDQLPDHESFLGHLCQKGGLEERCWEDPRTTVRVYEAEYFEE